MKRTVVVVSVLALSAFGRAQVEAPITVTFERESDDGKGGDRTFHAFVMNVDGVEVRAEAAVGRGDRFILRGAATVTVPPHLQGRIRAQRR